MSPRPKLEPAPPSVLARLDAIFAGVGAQIREARRRRRWTIARLAEEAGISRELVYRVERGEPASLEALVRLGAALALRLELGFEDPRAKDRPVRAQDPVHAAMVEALAERYAAAGRNVAVDEPFQHYQFAGRADLAVVDPAGRDLLHHEVKTATPNVGELAGAWNIKRQYLARVLAERHGLRGGFRSVTHVLTIAWTAESLHVLRLREATFRALGPDSTEPFERWWTGAPPEPGVTSVVVLLDPVGRPRAPAWVGLEQVRWVRPRHAGYAALLATLRASGRA